MGYMNHTRQVLIAPLLHRDHRVNLHTDICDTTGMAEPDTEHVGLIISSHGQRQYCHQAGATQ